MTCELYASTFSQLSNGLDTNLFGIFLGRMEVALEGTPRGVLTRVLECWEGKRPLLRRGSEIVNAQRLLQFSITMNWESGLTMASSKFQYFDHGEHTPRLSASQLFSCLGAPELRKLRENSTFQTTVVEWALRASSSNPFALIADAQSLDMDNGEVFLRDIFGVWLQSQSWLNVRRIVDQLGSTQELSLPYAVFLDELFARCQNSDLEGIVLAACRVVASSGRVPSGTLSHFHINKEASGIVAQIRRVCNDSSHETVSALLEYPTRLREVSRVLSDSDFAEMERQVGDIAAQATALIERASTLEGHFDALSSLVALEDVRNYRQSHRAMDHNHTRLVEYQAWVDQGEALLRELFGEHIPTIKEVLLCNGYRSVLFAVFAEEEFGQPSPFRASKKRLRGGFTSVADRVRRFLRFEGEGVDCYRVMNRIHVNEELELLGACFSVHVDFQIQLQALLNRLKVVVKGSRPPLTEPTPPVEEVEPGMRHHSRSNNDQTPDEENRFDNWINEGVVGHGNFGIVFKGKLKDGTLVAVKVLDVGREFIGNVRNEVDLMRSLHHKHIVQCLGHKEQSLRNGNYKVEIFMERCCSLWDVWTEECERNNDLIRSYTRQVVLGLQYLHNKKIAHHDIKMKNVLISVDGVVKIADFGCSNVLSTMTMQAGGRKQDYAGTPMHLPPEIIAAWNGDAFPLYDVKADIWALGCLVLELHGKRPWTFQGHNHPIAQLSIKYKGMQGFPENAPSQQECTYELWDFYTRVFERDPLKRATCDELAGCVWLRAGSVS